MAIVTTITAAPGIDTNTIVESTTDSGVEIKRITTQWEKVIMPGVTLTAAVYQIVSRITVTNEWEPYYYLNDAQLFIALPSTQLNSRRTMTEALAGISCSVALGFVWAQGGRFTTVAARLQVVERMDESYIWNDDCTLRSGTVKRYQSYSPLAVGGYTYEDGSVRLADTYSASDDIDNGIWLVSEDTTTWPNERATLAFAGVGHLLSKRWYQGTAGDETYGEVSASTPNVASIAPITPLSAIPERGSATVPQVFEEVLVADFDATDASGYAKRTESPGMLPYPESIEELIAIATRRIRRACSDTLDIPHNCIPFLRVGDHVSVTNRARNLVDADAYVTAIKRSANVLNGAMRQVTTVKIPPSWI